MYVLLDCGCEVFNVPKVAQSPVQRVCCCCPASHMAPKGLTEAPDFMHLPSNILLLLVELQAAVRLWLASQQGSLDHTHTTFTTESRKGGLLAS